MLIHVRMLEGTAQLQAEALGILGVNLIHGAPPAPRPLRPAPATAAAPQPRSRALISSDGVNPTALTISLPCKQRLGCRSLLSRA